MPDGSPAISKRKTFRPAPGVVRLLLDGETVVFSETRQSLYRLNATAGCIWDLMSGGTTEAALADSLQVALDLPRDRARAYSVSMLAAWSRLGLISLDRPQRPRPDKSDAAVVDDVAAVMPEALHAGPGSRCYRLAGLNVVIRCRDTAIEDAVHPLMRHLEAPPRGCAAVVIDVDRNERGYGVRFGGDRSVACRYRNALAPLVVGAIGYAALERSEGFMALHAAAMATSAGALLLPGVSGSGKSTLAAALTAEGWDYLSDDIAILEEGRLDVIPVPLPIALKERAWPLLANRYRNLQGLPVHHRCDGQRVRYVQPPPASRSRPSGKARPVRWIVFPRFHAAASTAVRRIGQREALESLLSHGRSKRRLTAAEMQRLADWLSTVACFAMPMSDLNEAVHHLRHVVDAFATTVPIPRKRGRRAQNDRTCLRGNIDDSILR